MPAALLFVFPLLGLLSRQWAAVTLPAVGWPLYYVGLNERWWGCCGTGDAWEVVLAVMLMVGCGSTAVAVVLGKRLHRRMREKADLKPPWGLAVSTAAYLLLYAAVVVLAELTLGEAAVVAAVLASYAYCAHLVGRPWTYVLAAGPWLLAVAWVAYVGGTGLDCSSCDDAGATTVFVSLAALVCVAVFLVGPGVAIARRLRGRRHREDGKPAAGS